MADLERMFREYHAPVVRYLTRRVGDRDLVEELAQERSCAPCAMAL
jgi:RNA polymerase sigma-70 factor (ECF subfamily)